MMKLMKSLQKTLNPFTKMVKNSNKLMFLFGVLLLLGLVLLVKMYIKKREGFNENDIIVLEDIGIESVDGGWKIFHSEVKDSNGTIIDNVREARFTKGNPAPSPLTIKYHRSDNTFTIHADWGDKVWNLIGSSSVRKKDNYNHAEFLRFVSADKMLIFFTGKDSDDNPKYKIRPIIYYNKDEFFLNYVDNSPQTDEFKAYFIKRGRGNYKREEFYFIDTNNNKKIDLFAKILEKEKTNIMSGLKTNFDLDVQPTDIDNAFTKINTKYTTYLKTKLNEGLGIELTDTNTVNNVVGKAKTKYDGLQTVLKNQGFMYRPASATTTTT